MFIQRLEAIRPWNLMRYYFQKLFLCSPGPVDSTPLAWFSSTWIPPQLVSMVQKRSGIFIPSLPLNVSLLRRISSLSITPIPLLFQPPSPQCRTASSFLFFPYKDLFFLSSFFLIFDLRFGGLLDVFLIPSTSCQLPSRRSFLHSFPTERLGKDPSVFYKPPCCPPDLFSSVSPIRPMHSDVFIPPS